jgi:protein-L-isoaspartate O-methyltransferase
VRDSRLLEAIAAVPRAQFVPGELAARAYQDEPLPIPYAWGAQTQPLTKSVHLQEDRISAPHGVAGELQSLGIAVSATSVRTILTRHGSLSGAATRRAVMAKLPPSARGDDAGL